MTGSTQEDTYHIDILNTWGDGCRYCEDQFTLLQQDAPIISDAVSSGILSLDLGDIWVNGCPKIPSCCSHNDCGCSVESVATHEEGAIAGSQLQKEEVDMGMWSTWNMLEEVHLGQVNTYLDLPDILTLRCNALTW